MTDQAVFYVVGNGPSLRTQVLDALPDGRWIGMNAAYKYWDIHGKYPRFYSCLDPVVVVQHKDAIERMLAEGKIEAFFLHEAILSVSPQLEADPRVTLRNVFLKGALQLPISPLSNYKQTTGVLATRFCIEQGFRNLCLLGIDCNYVEQIDEAQTSGGLELTVQKDVARNPNYFFDAYQEKSEKYQVPNPSVHSGNLHLQSFVALRNDIRSSGLDVRVRVGARESLLSRSAVFPWHDVEASLGLRRLDAIAVPLTPGEVDGFLEQMALWVDPRLNPSFGAVHGVVLHIFLTCEERPGIRDRIDAALRDAPELSRWFSAVRVSFLALSPQSDYYIKGAAQNVFCSKSGPNVFWLSIMAACRDYRHTFQMEADCVPLRAGWLDALEQAVLQAPVGAWMIGANYAGPTRTAASNVSHINGNAIFATGNADFQQFLDGDFTKSLQWGIARTSNNIAYDVALAQGLQRYDTLLDETGIDLRPYLHRFVHTPTILNLGGTVELESAGR